MANDEDLARLQQGVAVWNEWREQNPGCSVDLSGAYLTYASLNGADLRKADLSRVKLRYTFFVEANLRDAKLVGADLTYASLNGANLSKASLVGADLSRARQALGYEPRVSLREGLAKESEWMVENLDMLGDH